MADGIRYYQEAAGPPPPRPAPATPTPGVLEFTSSGIDRRAVYKGERRNPTRAYIWLDGGNEAIGATILANIHPGVGEIHIAPDGITHNDGTSTWVKLWTPEDGILADGVDRDVDTQMLLDLQAAIVDTWPSVRLTYCGGYSGGGGLVEEQICRGVGADLDAYFVFKRPLHESQVDEDGTAIIEPPQKPLLLWMSTTDFEHNDAVDHVGLEGTVAAYVAAYGSLGYTLSTQYLGGYRLNRYDHVVPTGSPAFTYIEQLGGAHDWVNGIDGIFRNFVRTIQP